MVIKNDVKTHFDHIASEYDEFKRKNQYYYDSIKNLVLKISGRLNYSSVLDIGCGTGELLNHLNPKTGMGVDISPEMIRLAKRKFHKYEFNASDFDKIDMKKEFDLIIIIDVIEHLGNINKTFSKIRSISKENTKIIISSPSYYWKLVLYIGEKLKMKMPEGDHKWIPPDTLKRIIKNHGFEIEEFGYRLIVPKKIPVVSKFLNSVFYKIPVIKNLGLVNYIVCRTRR